MCLKITATTRSYADRHHQNKRKLLQLQICLAQLAVTRRLSLPAGLVVFEKSQKQFCCNLGMPKKAQKFGLPPPLLFSPFYDEERSQKKLETFSDFFSRIPKLFQQLKPFNFNQLSGHLSSKASLVAALELVFDFPPNIWRTFGEACVLRRSFL